MIPTYHGYDTPALVHAHHTAHHPVYAGNNNSVAEAEVPKYARWETEQSLITVSVFLTDNCGQWAQECKNLTADLSAMTDFKRILLCNLSKELY